MPVDRSCVCVCVVGGCVCVWGGRTQIISIRSRDLFQNRLRKEENEGLKTRICKRPSVCKLSLKLHLHPWREPFTVKFNKCLKVYDGKSKR